MLKEFIAYLNKQVSNGSIYVLGSEGQTGDQITEAWIKKREHNNAYNYNRAIKLWKARLAAGFTGLRAFDCSGLGVYWLKDLMHFWKSDHTAHGMMGECEKISRTQLHAGDWVFRVTLGHAHHIGYVVDESLKVIESKGRSDGVVKRTLNASGKKYWNAYGRPRIFKEEIEGSLPKTYPEIKKGAKGADVVTLQELLNRHGEHLKEDGDFGSKTEKAVKRFQKKNKLEVDGIVGPKTWGKLL